MQRVVILDTDPIPGTALVVPMCDQLMHEAEVNSVMDCLQRLSSCLDHTNEDAPIAHAIRTASDALTRFANTDYVDGPDICNEEDETNATIRERATATLEFLGYRLADRVSSDSSCAAHVRMVSLLTRNGAQRLLWLEKRLMSR
jgi:hypothetical protein